MFNSERITDDMLILKIRSEIRVRIEVDFQRLKRGQFEKWWVNGSRLCSVQGDKVKINFA